MDKTLISVIMPVYNGEDTIVDSLKTVSESDVEIIVVDDGSTDTTLDVCKKYAANRDNIKVLHQENSGPAEARLNGIRNATGKYIMFLDSDDGYFENTINRVKQVIEKYNSPDLIRFRYERVPDGRTQDEYFNEDEKYVTKDQFKKDVYPMFLNGYMLNAVWSNCVKKEILDKIVMDEDEVPVRFGEDLLYSLHIFSLIENAVFLKDIMYKYIFRSNSATRTKNKEKLIRNFKDVIVIYTKLYEYLVKWDMLNESNVKLIRGRLINESNDIINRL